MRKRIKKLLSSMTVILAVICCNSCSGGRKSSMTSEPGSVFVAYFDLVKTDYTYRVSRASNPGTTEEVFRRLYGTNDAAEWQVNYVFTSSYRMSRQPLLVTEEIMTELLAILREKSADFENALARNDLDFPAESTSKVLEQKLVNPFDKPAGVILNVTYLPFYLDVSEGVKTVERIYVQIPILEDFYLTVDDKVSDKFGNISSFSQFQIGKTAEGEASDAEKN